MTMSEQATLGSWAIPSSLGIGVNYYYKDILRPSPADVERGASYTQNFIREHIARCDDRMHPQFKSIYDEGQISRKTDRPQISWSGTFGILEDAGVSKEIIDQIEPYLAHAAYKRGNSIDFLLVKEFLAYCGIDGLYDFENSKHFPVTPKVQDIPASVIPAVWQSEGADEVRLHVAELMDSTGAMNQYDAEINKLNKLIWGPYGQIVYAEITAGREVDDEPHRQAYLDSHPELAAPLARLEEILAAEKNVIQEMKDKYAPMDPSFKLPSLGTPYDLHWNVKGEKAMHRRIFFKDRLQAYHKQHKIKSGDENHIKFDWSAVKVRAFAVSDWALRDFTMSQVNRSTKAVYRRHDIPRNYVSAVLQEKEDGLLGILKTPYRIEFTDEARNKFNIIFNDTVVDTSTVDAVLELKAKNDIEDAALALEGSDLVKVYEIEPVEPTVRERIPLKSALEGRTDLPPITWVEDHEDFDEVVRRARLERKQQNAASAQTAHQEAPVAEMIEPEIQPVAPIGEVVASAEQATPPAPETAEETPVVPVVEDAPAVPVVEETPVLEGEPATLTGEQADLPAPETAEPVVAAVTEPTGEATVEPSQAPVPKPRRVRMVDEGGDELPFPNDPVGYDDQKPQSESVKADEVAIQFNVNQPGMDLSATPAPKSTPGQSKTEPAKKSEPESPKPGQTPGAKTGKEQTDKTEPKADAERSQSKPNAQKDTPKNDSGKSKGSISGEEALKRLLEVEKQKAMAGQRVPGAGGGMGGMGMGGMGGMNRLPPSYTVDLGLNALFGGLRSAGSGLMNVFKPSSSAINMDPAQRAEWINSNADQLAKVRGLLEAGTGEDGQPLSTAEQEKGWTKLTDTIQGLDKATKGLSKAGEGQVTEEVVESLRKASRELEATKDLADKSAKKPGKIGEMAREAQATMQTLAKALEMIVRLIMRAFSKSKDRDNAPSL
jgi:hypothetical protein